MKRVLNRYFKKVSAQLFIAFLIVLGLVACGGSSGSGGGEVVSNEGDGPALDGGVGTSDDQSVDSNDTGISDEENAVVGGTDSSSDPTGGVDANAGTESDLATVEGAETDAGPTNTPDAGADESVVSNEDGLSQPLIVATEGGPAPGIPDTNLYRLRNDLQVTDAGAIMFSGSMDFSSEDTALWGGTLSDPRLLLRTGMSLDTLPASVSLSSFTDTNAYLGSDGTVSVPATFTGSRTIKTVLHLDNSVPTVVFRNDEPVDIAGQSYEFDSYEQIRHYGETIAVVANSSINTSELVLWNGADYEFIAPTSTFNSERILLAPLQDDGCRIVVRNEPAVYTVREDGSVVFNARVLVEEGAQTNVAVCPDRFRIISNSMSVTESTVSGNFQSVVSYKDGEYDRIVSTGDPVPNMENTVFTNVSVVRVLADGALLVAAELNDITITNEERQSRWIFRENSDPVLVFLEGETVDSNVINESYSISVGNIYGYGGIDQGDYSANGATLLVDSFEVNRDDVVTWMLYGQAHMEQPYTELSAVGASPLQPVLVTGYPAPAEYPSSSFWSYIGETQLIDEGGIFYGNISDSAPNTDNPIASALWKFDKNGEINSALAGELIVTVNEIPRTVNVPASGWQVVGGRGIVFVETGFGVSDRIMYIPFE